MSISAINSVTSSSSSSDLRSLFRQQRTDFQTLATAIQSGDLSAAQSAFSQWQTSQGSIATVLASKGQARPANVQINADIQALGGALNTGSISDVQKAFAQLQTDMQAARAAHHGKHSQEQAGEKENDGDADDGVASKSGATQPLTQQQLLELFLKQLRASNYNADGTPVVPTSALSINKLA
jgi:hypothetical protein